MCHLSWPDLNRGQLQKSEGQKYDICMPREGRLNVQKMQKDSLLEYATFCNIVHIGGRP